MSGILELESEQENDEIVLRTDAAGGLAVLVGGEMVPVRLRQCFPWSEPSRHLSLRNEEDTEIALVADPADLPEASRAALETALASAGFVFQVTRVVSIDEEVEIRHWVVVTAQGGRSFQTHLDDWPRALPDGGILIRDVAGDLYRLAAANDLDKKSRALLWAFVD